MRIVVFGATGGTGRALLKKLLADSEQHEVVAVCRNPSALDDVKTANTGAGILNVVKGDLFDAASVATAVQGADVVVFTAGIPDIKTAATKKTTVYSVGGQNMLDAMKAAGVKRLVAVTSQGVIPDPNEALFFKYFLKPVLMADMYRDMIQLEALIQDKSSNSNLSYTILRPTQLVNDRTAAGGTEKLCVGEGFLPAGSSHKVSRDELAGVIVDAVKDEAGYAGKVLHVSH